MVGEVKAARGEDVGGEERMDGWKVSEGEGCVACVASESESEKQKAERTNERTNKRHIT